MAVKRALIVDDSKSARAFLSRILEKYDLEVESAESAEQAIEYLGHHHPDVIFMDHQMPGMDGLQAVQVIKNNPRTAMIPIMMYTSQEGELYLGQARALGAVGVLPKQIKPTDVSKVLYQLHLVPDRRSTEQTTFRPMTLGDITEGVPAAATGKALTETALRDQMAELRRVLVASLDSQADRIASDVRRMLPDGPVEVVESPPPSTSAPPVAPLRAYGGPWIALALAVIVAFVSTLFWWQESRERRALATELSRLRAAPGTSAPLRSGSDARVSPLAATAARETATGAARGGRRSPGDAKPIIEPVPYGAEPLSGPRLELLRQLFDRLANEGYRGTVEIRTFAGRFCLVGNRSDGFSLPLDEAAFARCDWVGVPPEEPSAPAPRVPLAFANLTGGLRSSTHGAIDVQVLPGDPTSTVAPYPAVTESLTAGEWNRAASANNRIEVRVR